MSVNPTHLWLPVHGGMADEDEAVPVILPSEPQSAGNRLSVVRDTRGRPDAAESESGAILAAIVAAIRTGRSGR